MEDRRRNVALPLAVAPAHRSVLKIERQDVLPGIAGHGEHQPVARGHRARYGVAPEPSCAPVFLSGFRTVGDDLARPHRHDQRGAVSGLHHRRRCPAHPLGPSGPPPDGAGGDVQGRDEGPVAFLDIALDHYETGRRDEHGRGGYPHSHGSDTPEVLGPEEVPFESERVKTLRPEPGNDPLPVANRGGVRIGTDPVAVVVGERSGAYLPAPAQRSAPPVEGEQQHVQPLVGAQAVGMQELLAAHEMDDRPGPGHLLAGGGRGEENQIAHDDGRRMPLALNGRLPADVLVRSPAKRGRGFRVRLPTRAPPLRPLRNRRRLCRGVPCEERRDRNGPRRATDPSTRQAQRAGVVSPAAGERKA